MTPFQTIESIIKAAGPNGASVCEIKIAGIKPVSIKASVSRYWQKGLLFRVGYGKHIRYFTTEAEAKAYDWPARLAEIKSEIAENAKARYQRRLDSKREGRKFVRVDPFPQFAEVVRKCGKRGASIAHLETELDLPRGTLLSRIKTYLDKGDLVRVGKSTVTRYFLDQQAASAYAAAIERRTKPNGATSPWRQETPTKRNTTHQPHRPAEIINNGVEIQRIPCSNDYRFSVSPHFKGEFTREWQEKRA